MKFKEYLYEANNKETFGKDPALNRAKGEYAEILLGKLLNGGKHMDHYRSENMLTPEQAFNKHLTFLSSANPKALQHLDHHIQQSHDLFRKYLASEHGIPEHEKLKATWTSNGKYDIERLTGEKNSNSRADLVVTQSKPSGPSYAGLSLKVGSGNPANSNSGLTAIAKIHNLPDELLKNHHKEHQDEINQIMKPHYQPEPTKNDDRKKLYKLAIKGGLGQKAYHAAQLITGKSVESKHEMAKIIATGFNHLPERNQKISSLRVILGADKTKHPEIRMYLDTKKNITHITNPEADFNKAMKSAEDLSAQASGSIVQYHAKCKKCPKIHKIASLAIKNESGPHTTIKGTGRTEKGFYELFEQKHDFHKEIDAI